MTSQLLHGDCLELLATLPAESIDACVTDPPYGIGFMGKEWDTFKPDVPRKQADRLIKGEPIVSDNPNINGRRRSPAISESQIAYDYSVTGLRFFQAWTDAWAREVLRVLKPGGYAVVCGAPRAYHRMACGLEDAGFEIRDCLAWIFGSGFPKSLQIGCRCETKPPTKHYMRYVPEADLQAAVQPAASGDEVLLDGMPEPALQGPYRSEPAQGTSGRGESGMEGRGDIQAEQGELHRPEVRQVSSGVHGDGSDGRLRNGASVDCGEAAGPLFAAVGGSSPSGPQHQEQRGREPRTVQEQRPSQARRGAAEGVCPDCGGLIDFRGWGTALKPAHEPIVLARKPFKGTVKANVAQFGTGALNIDACRIGDTVDVGGETQATGDAPNGRWPANVALDEWYEQVLFLKYNTPSDAARVIREYFNDYCDLSAVWQAVRHIPQSVETEPSELLQNVVLCGVAEREPEGRRAPDAGATAQRAVNRPDAAVQVGDGSPGAIESAMEGRSLSDARVLHGCDLHADASRSRVGDEDGPGESRPICAGASVGHGPQTQTAAAGFRGSASPEWEQTGQPAGESGNARQRDAQAHAPSDREGTQAPASRERIITRDLEVLESQIPRGWLVHFAPTGKSVRRGAAMVLDEQSGITTSNANPNANPNYKNAIYGRGMGGVVSPANQHADFGGASRFYFVAKASRKERDYGCEHLKGRSSFDTVSRDPSSAGANNPRAGAGRTSVLNTCEVVYKVAYVDAVLSRRLQADTETSRQKATVGSTTRSSDGSVWSMCWCGSPSTDPYHPAVMSIIETETSSITPTTTSNCSQRPHTNGCMAAAFGVMAAGGNLAAYAEFQSPWKRLISTSPKKAGPSTADVDLATSIASWLTSAPVGGGQRVEVARNFHPT